MQTLGREVGGGAFAYAASWPTSGGRVPSIPPVDFHDILAAVQGKSVQFRSLI